jgi:hypothetical protein
MPYMNRFLDKTTSRPQVRKFAVVEPLYCPLFAPFAEKINLRDPFHFVGKASFAIHEHIARNGELPYCANPSPFVESRTPRISLLQPNPVSLVE